MEKINNDTRFIKHRLRLFLSVDLIGSTAFKQSKKQAPINADGDHIPSQPWLEPIQTFYHEFENDFTDEWASLSSKEADSGPPPELWKILGDELIFFKEITNHQQIFLCIHAWVAVVQKRRIDLLNQDGLDLKSVAWIAGFPFFNAELAFPMKARESNQGEDPLGYGDTFVQNMNNLKNHYDRSNMDQILLDFIGPAMDTGFRLANFATEYKMPLSLDLAYIFGDYPSWYKDNKKQFPHRLQTFFLQKERLKGVISEKPYPIFYLKIFPEDTSKTKKDSLAKIEQKFIKETQPVSSDQLFEYCTEFLEQNLNFPIRPYITDDPRYNVIPKKHTGRLKFLESHYLKSIDEYNLRKETLNPETPTTDSNITPEKNPAEAATSIEDIILKKNL